MKLISLITLLSLNVLFAAAKTQFSVEHDETTAQMQELVKTTGDKQEFARTVINYFKALLAGGRHGSVTVDFNNNDAAIATGSVNIIAGPNTGDTITIGTATLTAVANGSTASTDQFEIGSTETVSATNIAAAINLAANSFDDFATATSSSSLVTISAKVAGTIGNAVALAESTSEARMTVSGANLTGGSEDTSTVSESSYGFGK